MARHQQVIGGGLVILTLGLGSMLLFDDAPGATSDHAGQSASMNELYVGGMVSQSSPGLLNGTPVRVGDIQGTSMVTLVVSPMSLSVSPTMLATPLITSQPIVVTPTPRSLVSPTISPQGSPRASSTVAPSESPKSSPVSTPAAVTLAPVVITEIAWAGTKASTYHEWLELYNPNEVPISLEGWEIKSGKPGEPIEILAGPLTKSIAARGCYIVMRKTTSNDSQHALSTVLHWIGSFGGSGLHNDGEKLILVDKGGQIQDQVGGDGSWYGGDAVTKASMERIDPGVPGNSAQNWRIATSLSSVQDEGGNKVIGTPGTCQ